LRDRHVSAELSRSSGLEFWQRFFELVPEAKPLVKKMLIWSGVTAFVIWPVGFIILFLLARSGLFSR